LRTYLYPQNLKATANIWLWSLRDFAILTVAALIAVLIFTGTFFYVPAVVVLIYAFMTIRLEDITVMDFLRYAIKFFITTQQYFEWRQAEPAPNSRTGGWLNDKAVRPRRNTEVKSA
jgi:hypothetical protein